MEPMGLVVGIASAWQVPVPREKDLVTFTTSGERDQSFGECGLIIYNFSFYFLSYTTLPTLVNVYINILLHI